MKIFVGKVISKKMHKTATIAVERVAVHPVYKKRIKRVKKYQVHDEIGVEVDQVVKFAASKPYSKTKKWKITEIVKGNKKGDRVPNIKKSNTESTENINSTENKKKTPKRNKKGKK